MTGWETGWGLEFLVWMNNLGGRGMDIALEPFHWIGGGVGYAVLMPVVFWSIDDRLGRRLYLLAMSGALINGALKAWWARPRPYRIDPVRIQPAHLESSFGIPSGHAQGGTVLGLFFARLSRRRMVRLILYAAIVGMGISRMIIGVHFLQDVLAGWILGVLIYIAFIRLEKPVSRWFTERPSPVLAAFGLIPAAIVLGWDALVAAGYPETKNLLATGGALTGIVVGMALEKEFGAYRSDGTAWQRVVRALLGLLLFGGAEWGLSSLFHRTVGEGAPAFGFMFLYILRYSITGFVGYWLIPEIFVRFRLASFRNRG